MSIFRALYKIVSSASNPTLESNALPLPQTTAMSEQKTNTSSLHSASPADDIPSPIDPQDLPALFALRPHDAHKGSFGSVAIVGGGAGMVGAALLAARAALKCGAGKVLVGLAQDDCPIACDMAQPELMVRSATSLAAAGLAVDVWVAGCGLGKDRAALDALHAVLAVRDGAPIVLDADGLNLLAEGQLPSLGPGPVILTPHPAEAARLLQCSTTDIQAHRVAAARKLSEDYQAWIVLKGAGTLVCAPRGRCWLNSTGNPGLATAGTGDVLAGVIGSLIAQKIGLEQAVPGAVWLHGAAADALVKAGVGPIGLTAGELADAIRQLRNYHAREELQLIHR